MNDSTVSYSKCPLCGINYQGTHTCGNYPAYYYSSPSVIDIEAKEYLRRITEALEKIVEWLYTPEAKES